MVMPFLIRFASWGGRHPLLPLVMVCPDVQTDGLLMSTPESHPMIGPASATDVPSISAATTILVTFAFSSPSMFWSIHCNMQSVFNRRPFFQPTDRIKNGTYTNTAVGVDIGKKGSVLYITTNGSVVLGGGCDVRRRMYTHTSNLGYFAIPHHAEQCP